jgi:hypothetical protein
MRRHQTRAIARAICRLAAERALWFGDTKTIDLDGIDPIPHEFVHPARYQLTRIAYPGDAPLAAELAAELGMSAPLLVPDQNSTCSLVTDAAWNAAHPGIGLEISVNLSPMPSRPVAPTADDPIWGPIIIERGDLEADDDVGARRTILAAIDECVAGVEATGAFAAPALDVHWAQASLTPDAVPLVQVFKRWITLAGVVEDLSRRGARHVGSKPSFGKSFYAYRSTFVELRSFYWQERDWLRSLLVYLSG